MSAWPPFGTGSTPDSSRPAATCGPSAAATDGGASASRTLRDDGPAAVLRLDSAGVATSGDYRIYYDEDRTNHHIITPGTGRSPTEDTSVIVVAPDAETADAYSTAAFVMDDDRASSILDARDGLSALFLTRDGGRRRTDGWAERRVEE